jgi:hypothetical protein
VCAHTRARGRYSPLAALEIARAALRLRAWAASGTLLRVGPLEPADRAHLEARDDARALLADFARLRRRYGAEGDDGDAPGVAPAAGAASAASAAGADATASLSFSGGGDEAPCARDRRAASGAGAGPGPAAAAAAAARAGEDAYAAGLRMLRTAELLHLLRPVLYVWMLRRHSRRCGHFAPPPAPAAAFLFPFFPLRRPPTAAAAGPAAAAGKAPS